MSAKATAWAWEQELPANEKILLLAYADQSRDDGAAQVPQAEVVTMTGASVRTVRANVAKLEERELLRRHPRHEGGQRIADVVKLAVDGATDLPADFAGPRPPAGFSGRPLQGSDDLPAGFDPTGEIRRTQQSSSPSGGSSGGEGRRARQDSPVLRDLLPEGFVVEGDLLGDAEDHLRRKVKVDGRQVTPEEMVKAVVAIGEVNAQSGSQFGVGAHLRAVVMRIRERPSYDADAHRRLVQSAWRLKWWERGGRGRRPTPAVVYGNERVFEQVVQDAVDEKNGRKPDDLPASGRRFTRED